MAKFISRKFIDDLKEELGFTRVSTRTGNSNTSRPMTDNSRDNQRSDGVGGSRDNSDYGLFGNKDFSLLNGLGSLFGSLGLKDVFTELTSYLHTLTRGQLTGAEREQNVFNAEQAAIQRGFEERMSNTAYQRQVADMQAAGINPAVAFGSGGASTPSGSVASGSASSGNPSAVFDLILGLQNMKIQKQISSRQLGIEEYNAETNRISAEADAEKKKKETAWIDVMNQASLRSQELSNNLTVAETKKVYSLVDEISVEIKKMYQDIQESDERIFLMHAEEHLKQMQAYEIAAMLPYNQALSQAQTEHERNIATLAWLQAAKENHLIEGGYYDKLIKQMDIGTSVAEYNAGIHMGKGASKVGRYIQSGMQRLGDAMSGLNGVVSASINNLP